MLNKIIVCLIFSMISILIVPNSNSKAAMLSSEKQAKAFISVPKEIRKLADEKDWVELICYEAKSQGSEAIVSYRVLGEEVEKIIEKSGSYFTINDIPEFEEVITELELLLDKICASQNIAETDHPIKEFSVKAHEFRKLAQGDFALRIRSLFKSKADELKKEILGKLNGELEDLRKEAQDSLNEKAKAEASDFKLKIEHKLQEKIDQKFLDGDFKKFSNEEISIEVKKIIKEMEKEARIELKQKYENITEEEERQFRNKLKIKVNELGGEEKRQLQKIKNDFEKLEGEIKAAIANDQELITNKKRAAKIKSEIYKKIISFYLNEAKKRIDTNRSRIDEARRNGVKFETPDMMIQLIEKDFNLALKLLSQPDIDSVHIQLVFDDLQKSWVKFEENMSIIEDSASGDIISDFKSNMEEKFLQIENSINVYNHYFSEVEKFYESAKNKCEKGIMRDYYCPKADNYKDKYKKALSGKEAIVILEQKRNEVGNTSTEISRNELIEYRKVLLNEINEQVAIINSIKD